MLVTLAGGFVLLMLWAARQEQRRHARTERLVKAVCGKLGWTYRRQADASWTRQLSGFPPFNSGTASGPLAHVVTGDRQGTPVCAFEYAWQAGKQSGTEMVLVAFLQAKAPALVVRPTATLLERLGGGLWGEDIDFEDDAFSRATHVSCADRRFAYSVMHPGMVEFLKGSPSMTWAWIGPHLILHLHGQMSPVLVERMAKLAHGFAQRLPRHLYAQQGAWQPVPTWQTPSVAAPPPA